MSDAKSKLQEAARIFRYLSEVEVEVDRERQAKFIWAANEVEEITALIGNGENHP